MGTLGQLAVRGYNSVIPPWSDRGNQWNLEGDIKEYEKELQINSGHVKAMNLKNRLNQCKEELIGPQEMLGLLV
jgi:hypothetical protein